MPRTIASPGGGGAQRCCESPRCGPAAGDVLIFDSPMQGASASAYARGRRQLRESLGSDVSAVRQSWHDTSRHRRATARGRNRRRTRKSYRDGRAAQRRRVRRCGPRGPVLPLGLDRLVHARRAAEAAVFALTSRRQGPELPFPDDGIAPYRVVQARIRLRRSISLRGSPSHRRPPLTGRGRDREPDR
jgi:hypothetical protein